MATIKFTLGDSEIWHVIELDYELSYNWVKDVDILAYIIKQEQDKCKNWRAKKVQVLDDNGNVLAKSSNILEAQIDYVKKEEEQ